MKPGQIWGWVSPEGKKIGYRVDFVYPMERLGGWEIAFIYEIKDPSRRCCCAYKAAEGHPKAITLIEDLP